MIFIFEDKESDYGTGGYHNIKDDNVSATQKYLTGLSQIRVLGEQKFYEWENCDGLLGGIGNMIIDIDSVKEKVNDSLSNIKSYKDKLKLIHSNKIQYSV